jgi:hypothetical protein
MNPLFPENASVPEGGLPPTGSNEIASPSGSPGANTTNVGGEREPWAPGTPLPESSSIDELAKRAGA